MRHGAEPTLDAATLDGCRRGDPQAQRSLFERYRDRVYSVALHFLRGDEAGAQDVTQEVFVKVFRTITSFREDARLSTWLYRIVANTCHDELRKRKRLLYLGDVPPGFHPSVDAEEPTGVGEEVAKAIKRLSPKLRMAVLLRYYEDLSYDEIAHALNVTTGTIASRLNRAHAALAKELAHVRPGGPEGEEVNHVREA